MVEIVKASAALPFRNFLIYADSGAGKTVFSASGGRVLFIAPEDAGTISGTNMGYEFDKIIVRNYPEFVEAYEYLYDNQELLKNYDWVCIDSLTKLQQICMKEIVDSQRQERIAKEHDPDQPQLQDYGKLYILLEKMILAFNDLPVNVLYTALARLAEDPDGNEFLVPMLGSNKLKDYRVSMKCAAEMTSYGYFKVEVVDKPAPTAENPEATKKVKQRVIIWEDTGKYRGKDRTTRLTPKTVLPSRNALKFVTDIANGVIDRNGKPIESSSPAKKAVAKKVSTLTKSGANDTKVENKPEPEKTPVVEGTESKGDEQADLDLASVEA